MIITLNSLLGRVFMSSLFSPFSDILSCSSYGTYLSFLQFAALCVCFYVLSMSVAFPDFGEVVSYRRQLMDHSSAVLVTRAMWYRGVPYVYFMDPSVAARQITMDITVGWAGLGFIAARLCCLQ